MLIPIAAFFVFAVVMIAWGVITGEIAGPTKSKKLLDLRHRLWAGAPDEAGVDLLDRTRVVFVQMNEREQRLDHRLEDTDGVEIGMALEQPRPRSLSKNGPRSRFTTVRVEVCDHTGRKRLDVVRPRGLTIQALQVVDASGELLGTVRRQGRRTFVLHDAWGLPVGLIERRSGPGSTTRSRIAQEETLARSPTTGIWPNAPSRREPTGGLV